MQYDRAINTVALPKNVKPEKYIRRTLNVKEKVEVNPWIRIADNHIVLLGRKELTGSRQHNFAVNELLEKKRIALIEWRLDLAEEWILLAVREKEFLNTVSEGKITVETHYDQTVCALEKQHKSEQSIKNYQEKIDILKERSLVLQQVKNKMKSEIEKHSIYGDFLHSVKERYTVYTDYTSIVKRFEALEESKKLILKRSKKIFASWAGSDQAIQNLIIRKEQEVTKLQNKLTDMSSKYKAIKRKIAEQESCVMNVHLSIERTEAELSSLVCGILDIYVNMCSRTSSPKLLSGNLIDQLIAIRSRFDKIYKVRKMLTITQSPKINPLVTKIRFFSS